MLGTIRKKFLATDLTARVRSPLGCAGARRAKPPMRRRPSSTGELVDWAKGAVGGGSRRGDGQSASSDGTTTRRRRWSCGSSRPRARRWSSTGSTAPGSAAGVGAPARSGGACRPLGDTADRRAETGERARTGRSAPPSRRFAPRLSDPQPLPDHRERRRHGRHRPACPARADSLRAAARKSPRRRRWKRSGCSFPSR